MKFEKVETAESCTMQEQNSDFKIVATESGVMLAGTSPLFYRHSCLEPLGKAMGVAVRWHLNRAEARKALDVAKVANDKDCGKELVGKF